LKTLFINLSLRPDSQVRRIPVGLAYVVTAAKKAGFDFDLIDMDVDHLSYNDLRKILNEKKYDTYAFGAIVSSFKIVKEIAQIIRESNQNARIIAGNSVASSIPETLMEHTEVDIGVMGEADETIVAVLDALKNKTDLKYVTGIFYKEDGDIKYTERRPVEANLDNFGFPEWELFDVEKYYKSGDLNSHCFTKGENSNWMPLNTGRGCPYRCTFCYITVRDDKKRYRRYSKEAIVEEIKRLHNKYDANFISLWDDLTFPNRLGVKNIVNAILDLDFKISWNAPIRGDLFRKQDIELVKKVKESGCVNLGFSLENADEEILKAIDKHLEVDRFIEQAQVLNEVGVTPLTSVIFGYPQETPESIRKTLAVCEEAGVYPSVGFLLALPGTPIYNTLKAEGYFPNEYEYLMKIGDRQDFSLNYTTMSNETLVSEVTNGLRDLATKQGLEFDNPLKTVHYQKPKKFKV